MVKVVAKSHVKDGCLDEILKLSEEMVEKTLKEEGCIKYEIFQDVKDNRVMLTIEEWESEDALNRHMASEHFKRIVPQMRELREGPSELNVCKKLF